MKLMFSLLSLVILAGCASTPPTHFPEDQGVICYQNEEQSKDKQHTCLRVNSFSDPVKWHRVKEWQTLPEIPEN